MQASRPSVFIVAADPQIRDALSRDVTTHGLNAITFCSMSELTSAFDHEFAGCLLVSLNGMNPTSLSPLADLVDRHVEIPVVAICSDATVSGLVRSLRSVSIHCLERPVDSGALIRAIHEAFEADRHRRFCRQRLDEERQRLETLTRRERQVMEHLVRGFPGKTIAERLGISYRTLEKFRSRLMRKMAADSLPELVLMAVRLEVIDPHNLRPEEIFRAAKRKLKSEVA